MIQTQEIDSAILKLAADRGADKTICPSEVARHLGGQDEANWRPLMALIRERAVKLAKRGSVVIKKSGVPVEVDDFTGIYRIAISKE